MIKGNIRNAVITTRCQCQRSYLFHRQKSNNAQLTVFVLALCFLCSSSVSAQGESETPARAQGRFPTAPACRAARTQRLMYRAKYWNVAGGVWWWGGRVGSPFFCFVILNTTDVNSFLRDLISNDLHGRVAQQHPCSSCRFVRWHVVITGDAFSDWWMYKLHNYIHLQREIS